MRAAKFKDYNIVAAVVLLLALFVMSCNLSKPTEDSDIQSPLSHSPSDRGAIAKAIPLGRQTASGSQSMAGSIHAWASVISYGEGFKEDYIDVQTSSNATNIKLKVHGVYRYNSSCDPLGSTLTYVMVDNQPPLYLNNTNWINLPSGSHTFRVYASITTSIGVDQCSSCEPPPFECNGESGIELTVIWDSAQE